MSEKSAGAEMPRVSSLKEAVRDARIDMAERTGQVIDLRDAEVARLEILNESLDPVYADLPADIELFDRGITPGDQPRLWVDMIAYVMMSRDKRVYRFVQDTRFGRRVLAESAEVDTVVKAVTKYVARRLVERERVLVSETELSARDILLDQRVQRRRRWRVAAIFVLGLIAGAALLFAVAWLTTQR